MFVAIFALVAASAAPTTTTAVPAPAANGAPAAKERKICIMQEAVTGSITPKRVCKTKSEWDAANGITPAKPTASATPPAGTKND